MGCVPATRLNRIIWHCTQFYMSDLCVCVVFWFSTDQNPAKTQKKKCSAKELCRPIICICNDLYAPALRPLRELSEIFSFKGTKLERLVARLEAVCAREQVDILVVLYTLSRLVRISSGACCPTGTLQSRCKLFLLIYLIIWNNR